MKPKTKRLIKNAKLNFQTASSSQNTPKLIPPQHSDPVYEVRRTLKKISLEKVFEANEMSIKQTTKNNGEIFRDNYKNKLLEQLRVLEEERQEVIIFKEVYKAKFVGNRSPHSESDDFNELVGRRKKVRLNQCNEPKQTPDSNRPCRIQNFQLKEHEILEDLIAIRKSSIDLTY